MYRIRIYKEIYIGTHPREMTNSLLWKMAINIVDLPIKHVDFQLLIYQSVYESAVRVRVTPKVNV